MKAVTLWMLGLVLCIIAGACKHSGKHENEQERVTNTTNKDSLAAPIVLHYLDIEYIEGSLLIDSFRIEPNQLFHHFFEPYHIGQDTIQKLINLSEGVFDLRKIHSGKWLTSLYSMNDSQRVLAHLIYHDAMDRKVIYTVADSLAVRLYTLPVDTIVRQIGSRIDRTLYHSIVENHTSYELGIKLSEVFAWQVDFFKIDAGDYFKVIFEEYQVNGEAFGIGTVSAAEFYHRGDTFRAYRFFQDEDHTYFDEQGKSLRKAFLKAPLEYSRISSRYSKKRFHPVQKRWKAHLGTDYAAPHGTSIRTVGDGVVIASSYSYGNGNYVKVKHNSTYTTQYLHMSRRAVKNGQRVRQGQVIGYVGSTGLATGPHLCFRFWMNDRQVDPFSVKIPPSTPISEPNRPAFETLRDSIQIQLNQIPITGSGVGEVQ